VSAPRTLDALLTVQLNVAWAGEADCQPARFGWWKANLSEPANGGDLMRTLAPRTWPWAALIALREAGRRADLARAGEDRSGDRFVSIFRVSPDVDEQLVDRLYELRVGPLPPHEALPGLLFRLTERDEDSAFDLDAFMAWARALPAAERAETPRGWRLVAPPADPALCVPKLAALLTHARREPWPFPHAIVDA
jgi:hypothetical protein